MRCFNFCYYQKLKLVKELRKITEGEFFEVPKNLSALET